MVIVSVGADGSLQVSITPFSCARFENVPLNVRVEERHVALLLLFSISVTPVTLSGGTTAVVDATIFKLPLHTELVHVRKRPLLVQV